MVYRLLPCILALTAIISQASSSLSDCGTSGEEAGKACCSGSATDSHFFEGVEKRIELYFDVDAEDKVGLRSLPAPVWSVVCSKANCEIIHRESTGCFDSYILSESSLFVFRDRIMMKTCGTTVPLLSVDEMVIQAMKVATVKRPSQMVYSRSSFLNASKQSSPHHDLDVELAYLKDLVVGGVHVTGETVLLGDVDAKYWLVHTKQFTDAPLAPRCIMAECMMTGLPADTRSKYFKNTSISDEQNEALMASSLQGVLPFDIVGKCFEPCGYSCNARGITEEDASSYFTVHVTPEAGFSYASVEAIFGDSEKIEKFVKDVISVFQPEEVSVNLMVSQRVSLPDQISLLSGASYILTARDISAKSARVVYSLVKKTVVSI